MHNAQKEGESLRHFLRMQGITQADLAMKTGLSRNTILNYLNMTKLPAEFREILSNAHISWQNAQESGQVKSDKNSAETAMRAEIESLKRDIARLEQIIKVKDEVIEVLKQSNKLFAKST